MYTLHQMYNIMFHIFGSIIIKIKLLVYTLKFVVDLSNVIKGSTFLIMHPNGYQNELLIVKCFYLGMYQCFCARKEVVQFMCFYCGS